MAFRTLADRQASGDLPARVTVLPGQEGSEATKGRRCSRSSTTLRPAPNCISRLVQRRAGADGSEHRGALQSRRKRHRRRHRLHCLEAAFQDDIVAKGVNAAVDGGCVFFSAGGNDGNLTHGTYRGLGGRLRRREPP